MRIIMFALFLLTLAMFADVLFTPQPIILSTQNADLALQFIDWRDFGFGELRKGNLALWNPFVFSGIPFLGGFQSALLYPLNLLYLFLPLSKAINISIVLHVFLAGVFVYLWSSYRRLHPLACFLSSVLFMFCGAYFLHIFAGHLPHLCTMVWAPLIFLSIDGLSDSGSFKWCLLGVFAVTMQILAGFPQQLFYTAVAAVLYCGCYIIKTKQPTRIVLGIIGIYLGAFALGAVQLLTGIQAASESVRSGGVSYGFASMFSFPPENFITLLVPNFFGNSMSFPYWGRWYLWETSLFFSITGFILALYGAIYGDKDKRRFSAIMILMLFLLALGAYTPLFRILYHWVPGFNLFRGSSKFAFQASLFLILLSSIGLDKIIHSQIPRRMIMATIFGGILLGCAFLWFRYLAIENPQGIWQQIIYAIYSTGESYFPHKKIANLAFVNKAGLFACKGILVAAGTFLLLSALFFLRRYSRRVVYLIVLIAIIEIFLFARNLRPTFDLASMRNSEVERLAEQNSDDFRILYLDNPNKAMTWRRSNIWGYDPVVSKRYAEFMAFTQGVDPDRAGQYLKFSRFHPLFKMLRCRGAGAALPHALLIQDWLCVPNRDRIFAVMNSTAFDPQETVILQKMPDIKPIKSKEKGTVRILDSSTDHLDIEAHLPEPAILLITDPYSEGWRAVPLSKGAQKEYEIMPANYILQAIPLSRGDHHIRVEYSPQAFRIGKWISLLSMLVYLGLLLKELGERA